LGPRVYLPDLEDSGVTGKLDRLAGLLRGHTPDRLAAFWKAVPTMGKKQDANAAAGMLEEAIRNRIRALNLTPYRVGKMTKVDASVIQRFMAGERGLTLATADKLCEALDLTLSVKPYSTLDLDLVREREEAREKRERND
jgi:plasmid maintenance system antidote protein VapI